MYEMLPVAIEGVTDVCIKQGVYLLNENETMRVLAFYEGYGFKDAVVERINPAIGSTRDEVRAELPDGWTTKGNGRYWIDYIDADGVKQFSVFWKGTPWDYCTYVRR